MSIKYRIPFLLLCMVSFFCLDASAQIYIDKAKIEMTVTPGQYVADQIVVYNDSDEKHSVKIYMEDFAYKTPFDGSKEFFTPGTLPYSNAGWISYSPRELQIEPKSKQTVSYVFNVPPDANGGYYGILIFENVPDGEMVDAEAKTGLRLITRIGALIFLETDDSVKDPRIDNFRVDNGKLKFTILNSGNTIIRAGTVFYAMDEEGVVRDRGDLKDVFLPMGEKVGMELPLKTDLPTGVSTFILTFDLKNDISMVREVDIQKNSDSDIKILAVRE